MRVNELFSNKIFPNFPFKKDGWQAIAFDRARYDFLRCPKKLIESISDNFGPCITYLHGFGAGFNQKNEFSISIEFSVNSYSEFMKDKKCYSPEYYIVEGEERFMIWSDPDMFLFGCRKDDMKLISKSLLGGINSSLEKLMKEDFYLDDSVGSEDMCKYIDLLVVGT